MGKGDIRTRRGKVWRGTYGVTRPRRYKVVARPATRKVKKVKEMPSIAKDQAAGIPQEEVLEVQATTEATAQEEVTSKKPAAKKTPAKKAATKKAPEKKD